MAIVVGVTADVTVGMALGVGMLLECRISGRRIWQCCIPHLSLVSIQSLSQIRRRPLWWIHRIPLFLIQQRGFGGKRGRE